MSPHPEHDVPTVDVLRELWNADAAPTEREQGEDHAHRHHGPGKVCKNMVNVGFDGLAGPGADLGAAWRAKLEREGKLRPDAVSIRDLVLGPDAAQAGR